MPDSVQNKPSLEPPPISNDGFQLDMWSSISQALPNGADEQTSEGSLSETPYMLSEARSFYQNDRPPFVFGRSGKPVPKKVVIAEDGKYPLGTEQITELAYSKWNHQDSYWVMNHGGRKLIVKAFSGASRGGAAFRPWMGVEKDFQEPVAFSLISNGKRISNQRAVKRDPSSVERDEDNLSQRRSSRTTARMAKADAAERITNSFVSPVVDRREEIAVEMYATDEEGNQSETDMELKENVMPKNRPTLTPKTKPEIRRSSHNISNHKAVKQRFSRRLVPSTRRVRSKRQIEPASSPELGHDRMPRSKKARIAKPSRFADKQPESTANDNHPNLCQNPPSPNSPLLSPHKLLNTILYVSLPPSTDFVPIRLRSCSTIDTFFASVLNAYDLQESEQNLDAARVTFEWMPKSDKNRSWLVKKTVEDSFEMLLECVSAANVWMDEGKAIVRVEILMKKKG